MSPLVAKEKKENGAKSMGQGQNLDKSHKVKEANLLQHRIPAMPNATTKREGCYYERLQLQLYYKTSYTASFQTCM